MMGEADKNIIKILKQSSSIKPYYRNKELKNQINIRLVKKMNIDKPFENFHKKHSWKNGWEEMIGDFLDYNEDGEINIRKKFSKEVLNNKLESSDKEKWHNAWPRDEEPIEKEDLVKYIHENLLNEFKSHTIINICNYISRNGGDSINRKYLALNLMDIFNLRYKFINSSSINSEKKVFVRQCNILIWISQYLFQNNDHNTTFNNPSQHLKYLEFILEHIPLEPVNDISYTSNDGQLKKEFIETPEDEKAKNEIKNFITNEMFNYKFGRIYIMPNSNDTDNQINSPKLDYEKEIFIECKNYLTKVKTKDIEGN